MSLRAELAEKVINSLQDHAYVFGGYLRDKLAGEEFTDVDLFFPESDAHFTRLPSWRVAAHLKNLGLNVTKVRGGRPKYAAGSGVRRDTYEVSDPKTGVSIEIDAVTSVDIDADHPYSDLDADINSLYYDKVTHKILPHWVTPYKLKDIEKHIKDRTFEVPDMAHVTGRRLHKLIGKGYTPLNTRNPTSTIGELIRDRLGDKVSAFDKNPSAETPLSVRKDYRKMTGFEQFQAELKEAGWRAGTAEMAEGVKQGILLMLKDEGADDGMVAMATKFLETQAGTALVSELLGHGLPMAPFGIGDDPRAQKAAEEFRTDGYKILMQIMFRLLMKYMLPAIQSGLAKLPPVTAADMAELDAASKAKVRVESQPLPPDTLMQAQREAQAALENQNNTPRVMHH